MRLVIQYLRINPELQNIPLQSLESCWIKGWLSTFFTPKISSFKFTTTRGFRIKAV